jgi:tetratricopeptide (TPR) repeat protein
MQAGAALFKLQHEQAIAVAEQIFQQAVAMAKRGDATEPEYLKAVLEGENMELGDAYTWLGTCENKLGKAADAEGHYKAAAKAVEDEGVAPYADKFAHRVMLCRFRKDFARHKQLCDAWEDGIRKAASDGDECTTALLSATGIALQERASGLADEGKFVEAAELRAGKFVECLTRLQAHGLRSKGETSIHNVYDSVAALYLRANESAKAIEYLRKAVAATAREVSYADRFTPIGVKRGEDAKDWSELSWHPSLLGSYTSNAQDGDLSDVSVVPINPSKVTADEEEIIQLLLRVGDRWTVKKGKNGPETTTGAGGVGQMLLTLGNQLFAAQRYDEAERPLLTAAGMLQHDLEMQGVALHLLGASYFHRAKAAQADGQELTRKAAESFAIAAECKVGDGRCTRPGAQQGVSSLLFLGRCLFELGQPADAEKVTAQAINIARQVLGDEANETREAINAMMQLKRQLAGGGGG